MQLELSCKTAYALENEVILARTKFPGNRLLLAALVEEVGELARGLLEGTNWREEALQVACVALRIYEEGDATFQAAPELGAQKAIRAAEAGE